MFEAQRQRLSELISIVIDHRLSMIEEKLVSGYDIEWLKSEIKNIALLQDEACRLK